MSWKLPEQYRVTNTDHPLGSTKETSPLSGAFLIPNKTVNKRLRKTMPPLAVIAAKSPVWEHVSVSLPNRCPTWEEMCYIKDLFWEDGAMVIQYMMPPDRNINNHPFCLHMWRSPDVTVPVPPEFMV